MPKINNKTEAEKKNKESGHTDIVWARIDGVVLLILENERYFHAKRNKELTETVMNNYGIARRTAELYISEAKKEIRKIGQQDKKKAFIKAIRDREFLFTKAKGKRDSKGKYEEKPDLKLALEIVRDRDKLHGLYVDEIKHTGTISLKNIDLSKLTDEQLKILKLKIKNKENVEEYLKLIGLL